jgi:serine/threonine protein kinase
MAGSKIGSYLITDLWGLNDFGYVYAAAEVRLKRQVTVFEYFSPETSLRDGVTVGPAAAETEAGFNLGISESVAAIPFLLNFHHPNVSTVIDCFGANGTLYFIGPFLEGRNLGARLAQTNNVMPEAELRAWLDPVAAALTAISAQNQLAHNLNPENIVLVSDTEPVLISPAVFWPFKSVPSGDLLALGGLIFRCLLGTAAPSVSERKKAVAGGAHDPLELYFSQLTGKRSPQILEALKRCLALDPSQRFKSADEFREFMKSWPPDISAVPNRPPTLETQKAVPGAAKGPAEKITRPSPPPAAPASPESGRKKAVIQASLAVLLAISVFFGLRMISERGKRESAEAVPSPSISSDLSSPEASVSRDNSPPARLPEVAPELLAQAKEEFYGFEGLPSPTQQTLAQLFFNTPESPKNLNGVFTAAVAFTVDEEKTKSRLETFSFQELQFILNTVNNNNDPNTSIFKCIQHRSLSRFILLIKSIIISKNQGLAKVITGQIGSNIPETGSAAGGGEYFFFPVDSPREMTIYLHPNIPGYSEESLEFGTVLSLTCDPFEVSDGCRIIKIEPSSIAPPKTVSQLCTDRVLSAATVQGIYEGVECGDNCFANIRLDGGILLTVLAGEDEAESYFGRIGNKVTVTYEVRRLLYQFDGPPECIISEVLKYGSILNK